MKSWMNSCRNRDGVSRQEQVQVTGAEAYLLLLTAPAPVRYWLGNRSVFFRGIGRPVSESMPRETGRFEPPLGLPPKPPDGGVGRTLPFPEPPLPPEALPLPPEALPPPEP